jgi:hypothetical protein
LSDGFRAKPGQVLRQSAVTANGGGLSISSICVLTLSSDSFSGFTSASTVFDFWSRSFSRPPECALECAFPLGERLVAALQGVREQRLERVRQARFGRALLLEQRFQARGLHLSFTIGVASRARSRRVGGRRVAVATGRKPAREGAQIAPIKKTMMLIVFIDIPSKSVV